MSKVSTWGLKMSGIRDTAGLTKRVLKAPRRDHGVDIFYNTKNCVVFGREEWDGSHCLYGDHIVFCGTVQIPYSMQEIADFVGVRIAKGETI